MPLHDSNYVSTLIYEKAKKKKSEIFQIPSKNELIKWLPFMYIKFLFLSLPVSTSLNRLLAYPSDG